MDRSNHYPTNIPPSTPSFPSTQVSATPMPASESISGNKTVPPTSAAAPYDMGQRWPSGSLSQKGSPQSSQQSTTGQISVKQTINADEDKISINKRLEDTLNDACAEQDRLATKVKLLTWGINGAIILQVIAGSLTTGLSAVATTGRQTAILTTILGALTTILASYLAKARGSGEPETSRVRMKDLRRFIRQLKAFLKDYGHVDTDEYDVKIEDFRREFELILVLTNRSKNHSLDRRDEDIPDRSQRKTREKDIPV